MPYIEHLRSPFCLKGACQRARVQSDVAEHVTVVKEALRAQTHDYLHDTGRELHDEAIIALLPASNAVLAESSEERQSAFLAHLSTIFKDVQNKTPEAHRSHPKELNVDDNEQLKGLLGKACATCKGYCCELGGTHAFLDYWSLQRYIATSGQLSETQLIENYSAYLPTSSYKNSCVFHASNGCTLPENMRSITCNNYKCDDLINYKQNIRPSTENITYAAARKGRNILTIAIFSERTFEYVKEDTVVKPEGVVLREEDC